MEKQPSWADSFKLVGQLGFEIALPLVGFALGGRWLDQRLGSSPALLLVGMALAVFLSTVLVARKIKKMIE